MDVDLRVVQYRHAAEQMRRGFFDVEIPADGYDEVAKLGESLQALARSPSASTRVSSWRRCSSGFTAHFAR
jgi:hypothetical protein